MRMHVIDLLQPRALSNGEIRRWIAQRAVSVNGVLVTAADEIVDVGPGDKVQIGKHEEIEITEAFLEGKRQHLNSEGMRNG